MIVQSGFISKHWRRLGIDDLALLQQVGRDSYIPYYQHVWNEGGMKWYLEKCFGNKTLETDLIDPEISYYLPTTETGDIIGLLKLMPLQPVPIGEIPNALYLEKIYLLPAFYGKGYGQILLTMITEMAKSLGRDAVWLNVMQNIGPMNAYKKSGFEVLGKTQFPYEQLKINEREGWVMVKRL